MCLCTKFCAPPQVLFCLLASKKSDFDWTVKEGQLYHIVQGTSDTEHDHPTKDNSGMIITPTYMRDAGIKHVAELAEDCRTRGYVDGKTLSRIQRAGGGRLHVSENSREFLSAVAATTNKKRAAGDAAPDSECDASKKQKTKGDGSDSEGADADKGEGDLVEGGL